VKSNKASALLRQLRISTADAGLPLLMSKKQYVRPYLEFSSQAGWQK
jgi:hypothetical protein